MKYFSIFFLSLFYAVSAWAQVHPPIEAYGEKPSIRSVEISPSGEKILYILEGDGKQYLVAKPMVGEDKPFAVDVSSIKAHSAYFATNSVAILNVSETTKIWGYRGRFEYSAAFSVDLESGKIAQLLSREDKVHPGQSGTGRIIGIDAESSSAYMPAYSGHKSSKSPPKALFKAELGSRIGRIFARGHSTTKDWFVSDSGEILAREDFDGGDKVYRIRSKVSGKWTTVFEDNDAELAPFWIIGVKSDESALIINRSFQEDAGEALYRLNFDGEISEQLFYKEGREIDQVITDRNRKVYGVRYSGLLPSYSFFDSAIDRAFHELLSTYPNLNISIRSWSSDWSKVILVASGGGYKGDFLLFDTKTSELIHIADPRSSIPLDALAVSQSIEFKARDGLTIPSILTWPTGKEGHENLPAIILPHGGPHSYDQMGFDWMAQFFANRGYLVLQSNFRGSTGFGSDFMRAGYGEWGGKMQDDLTDGVNAMITQGWVDPSRVCIVGASYGGYAALAGGAYTPELYKCVIAVAAVADLKLLGQSKSYENGKDSGAYRSWKRTMGKLMDDKDFMKSKSPVHSAATFKAPVLLIHGKDDTVVLANQSNKMNKALKKAGKDVSYIKQKGADHWMTDSETRLETLQAMDAFLKEHNPVN